MACDTFIKISQKCKKHFVTVQVGEVAPFVNEILRTMPSIICDLTPHQIQTFYEAVGNMVFAQTDPEVC
jgi:exportin-1